MARIVARCQALPGAELFQYEDEAGARQTIGSADVNDYLRGITGEEFTAKDFRTWMGTLHAVAALEDLGPPATPQAARSAFLEAVDRVAERLNNTRAVCRKYYVHPAVFDTYEAGTLHGMLGNGAAPGSTQSSSLEPEEQAVVRLLRHVSAK